MKSDGGWGNDKKQKQLAGPSTALFAKCANNFAQDDNLFMATIHIYEDFCP